MEIDLRDFYVLDKNNNKVFVGDRVNIFGNGNELEMKSTVIRIKFINSFVSLRDGSGSGSIGEYLVDLGDSLSEEDIKKEDCEPRSLEKIETINKKETK